MTLRFRAAVVLLACLGIVAAACGGETSDSSDDATVTQPDAEPQEPEVTEPEVTEPEVTEPAQEPDTTEPEPEPDGDTEDMEEPSEEPDPGPPPNIFDDPRDGIFDEFQAMMDRGDHPFMQIDTFCHAHDPASDRVATGPGIEADSITLVHLRSRLEDFVSIGFATDVGDPAEMFEVFADYINTNCGGIRGRMIELHTIEIGVLGDTVEQDRNAACIQATEDLNGVILLNSSGFQGSATLCIVEDHETAFIAAQGLPDDFMQRGGDRMITLSPTNGEQLSWLAYDLIESGALEGKTIGMAAPDREGQLEPVQTALHDILEANGIDVAVFDVIGCGGGNVCTEGVVESVTNMREAEIDVFFVLLNVVSLPGYLLEMVNQGFEPGDVQFYASDFNSQAAELVASKIVTFAGEEAGSLYNGALIIDDADSGAYRTEGYEPRAFTEMCGDTYGANSPSGANYESDHRSTGSSAYGMVGTVCEIMRTTARAIYDAGDNPTREDIYSMLANLGPIDSNEMLVSSISPGKTAIPDAIHTLRFEYPCTKLAPFGEENICIYPIDEFRLAPR